MTNRASFCQLSSMVDFMEKHPQLAQGTMKNLEGRSTAKKLYNQLTATLNGISGSKKSPKGWAKYWADKKFGLKKAMLENPDLNKLSHIEKRMYELCFMMKEEILNDVKEEEDGSGHEFNDHDDEESKKSDMEEQAEETPISFVEQPMIDMEERQALLMEKLVKVMGNQSNALSQLAQASQIQANAMDKMAEATQLQARSLERIAKSFESIGASMVSVRHSISNMDNNLKRMYAPTT